MDRSAWRPEQQEFMLPISLGAGRPWLGGLRRWLPGFVAVGLPLARHPPPGPGFSPIEEAPHPGPAAFLPRVSMPGRPGVR